MSAVKKIHIRLKRSSIRATDNQKANLKGLGLTRREKVVVIDDNASSRGMIKKVLHLLEVQPYQAKESVSKKIQDQVEVIPGKMIEKKKKEAIKKTSKKTSTKKVAEKKNSTVKKAEKKTAKKKTTKKA
ncbi:MAG: 50S ribosomal protein L30 [Bdellovibrionales bacterium]|nr:50S ribosomal protein L30 [Bdellovibrionales bacterium]